MEKGKKINFILFLFEFNIIINYSFLSTSIVWNSNNKVCDIISQALIGLIGYYYQNIKTFSWMLIGKE
jgi:hypothetical protein